MAKTRVSLEDYPQLEQPGQAVFLRKADVWLVRGKKLLRAFSARCPHKPKKGRIVLGTGTKGCFFSCPLHSWTFSDKGKPTGKSKKGLRRLPVAVKDGVARIEH